MKSVGVLFGGKSTEHEISVITALQAIQALDSTKWKIVPCYLATNGKWYRGEKLLERGFYRRLPESFSEVTEVNSFAGIDVCLMAFHGQYGEDGPVQGLLELADIPYTGSGVTASAVAMNKYLCKMFLKAHGIPVLPAACIKRSLAKKSLKAAREEILATPGLEKFPLFVKPCNLGSSIGVSVAHDEMSLNSALAKVMQYDEEILIEPCVTDLLEINVSVLDGIASVIEIPLSAGGHALTYEDKYLSGGKNQEGMASLTRLIDPDFPLKDEVRALASRAFTLLRCSGVARLDFIVDKATGNIYFNELNAIPGSLSFYLWEKSGLLYTELLDRLIDCAFDRKSEQLSLERNIGFKALKDTI